MQLIIRSHAEIGVLIGMVTQTGKSQSWLDAGELSDKGRVHLFLAPPTAHCQEWPETTGFRGSSASLLDPACERVCGGDLQIAVGPEPSIVPWIGCKHALYPVQSLVVLR